jgi:hypothetical protein
MGIFDKIFGKKEDMEYKVALAGVSNPLMDKIDELPEREVREFFKTIIDAAERSLRGILFMTPEEFNFKKQVSKEDIDFWLRKVSLALMSYSYYFYDVNPVVKQNKNLAETADLVDKIVWERFFDYYNQIFDENINQKEIDYYALGLKEDGEKGYTESEDMEKVFKMANRDCITIASELLEKIWHEKVDLDEFKTFEVYPMFQSGQNSEGIPLKIRKAIFLGIRIWQVHQQIVQPFLTKLLTM